MKIASSKEISQIEADSEKLGITAKKLIENAGLKDTSYSGKTKQFYYDWNGKVYYERFMAIGTK